MDAGPSSTLAGELTSGGQEATRETDTVRRVLFVCMGNICRSPAAEGLFRSLLVERGLAGSIEVDSAGTIAYHQGELPDARMRQAASRRGYELDGAARPVVEEDFRRFDLIVAMDRDNLHSLEVEAGVERGRLRLFSSYLASDAPVDVPDPYYGGASGFDRVLDLVEAGCPALLEELVAADGC